MEVVLANSLPSKEALAAFLDGTANYLASSTKTCAVASSVLRTYFVLTDHEYGFLQFKRFVTKRSEALAKYFKWASESAGEDRTDCLNLYIDLIKILRVEHGEGPVGRKSLLTLGEMADMVGYTVSDNEHSVLSLDKLLKERNSDEDTIANATFLVTNLKNLTEEYPLSESSDAATSSPEPLVAQFAARQIFCIGDSGDERLTTGYWLNVPSATSEDDVNDNELVACDTLEVARCLLAGGADALAAGVRRLAGCRDARVEALPADDKRPAVALSRVRAEGGADAFRSRPPNTSRPPSLHVDDFTALHQPYAPVARPPRRAGSERARFAPHAHYRHLRGRGAWEGGHHFGHFASHYSMGGPVWSGRARGPRHRAFMR